MANDRIHAAQGKEALPMGGAIYCSFISTHLLSAYFLTAQTYKCMRSITRVHGCALENSVFHCHYLAIPLKNSIISKFLTQEGRRMSLHCIYITTALKP